MVQSQFSLSWDSYKLNISTGLRTLQQNGELVDMTLAAEGHFVKVHQVLIALSSPYLKQLILSAPCQHPVIFLNNMSHGILSLLLEYIYTGEVLVPSSHLSDFIDAAKSLHIKGLENVVEGNIKGTNIVLNLENSVRTSTSTKLDTNISDQNGELVDMTLAAEGHFVKVHQVLIALSSPYLKQLILSAPCQHPVIFLNNMSHGILSLLLEYIYTGEVLVPSEHLSAFIDAAKSLHIKGLENVVDGNIKGTNIVLNLENSVRTSTSTKLDTNISDQITLPTNARKIFIKQKNEPVATTEAKKQIWNMPTVSNELPNYSVVINDSATDNNDSFNDSNLHLQNKEELAKVSSNLQFTVSIRGSLQVILNRYIYNLHSSQSSGVRRWRCIDYRNRKCSAFVVTNGNIVINRANPHNHSFHDKKILDKIEKNAVYTALDEVQNYIDKEKAKDRDESMESESVPVTFATSLSSLSDAKTFQIVDNNA